MDDHTADHTADPDEDEDFGGNQLVTCPICGASGEVGSGVCQHWFASGGMGGHLIGVIDEGLVKNVVDGLQGLDDAAWTALIARAPAEVAEVLRLALDPELSWWWEGLPGVQQSDDVEFDEASGTWSYWDWFHPTPGFAEHLSGLASRVQAWLDGEARSEP